jgi:AhpD family alkylhydroperoxidase
MCEDQRENRSIRARGSRMTTEPARIDFASVCPAGVRAMVGLQRAVDGARLEPLLLELVKMRASQINGCAYCLDMHSKDARALGESGAAPAPARRLARGPLLRRARAGSPDLV